MVTWVYIFRGEAIFVLMIAIVWELGDYPETSSEQQYKYSPSFLMFVFDPFEHTT